MKYLKGLLENANNDSSFSWNHIKKMKYEDIHFIILSIDIVVVVVWSVKINLEKQNVYTLLSLSLNW